MTTARFVPFRSTINDVAVLQNRLNSIFHDFAQPGSAEPSETLATGNFVPAVDVYEDAQNLLLKLEVPGIRQEDLDIRVEGRVLTIKGERRMDADHKEENFRRVERRFGSFVRSFTLPATVNTEDVSAVSTDGVLTLTLAKKPEVTPKQIKVQIGIAQSAEKQVAGETAKA